jgi:hypothetical protein
MSAKLYIRPTKLVTEVRKAVNILLALFWNISKRVSWSTLNEIQYSNLMTHTQTGALMSRSQLQLRKLKVKDLKLI